MSRHWYSPRATLGGLFAAVLVLVAAQAATAGAEVRALAAVDGARSRLQIRHRPWPMGPLSRDLPGRRGQRREPGAVRPR